MESENVDDMEAAENGDISSNIHVESSKLMKSSTINAPKEVDDERGTWAKELDFILACVGWAVGLGNIWRFPYLCYKNGGGAFLIPYFLSVITCGVPVFLLEIGLGQYMRLGSIGAWSIAPAFQGIGVASFSISLLMNIYYIIVMVWALFYLYMSLTSVLPWSHCNNEWNTDRCFVHNKTLEISMGNMTEYSVYRSESVDSAVEFWERRVLQQSGDIYQPGSLQGELALCLFIVWVLVYFCVWRGVRWSGKVVYFTALFPYVVLVCLFIRGVTLEGAAEGIKFYLKPDFTRLADPQVWVDGGTQVFFSYAIALGALITLGSYNKFTNNFYRDVIIVSCVNTGTSLFGGLVVFSVLGFMAHEQNISVAEVVDAGPGLVFIAYPKAVTQMPVSTLWSILFFIMVLLVGMDSQFIAVEGLLTPILDMFPKTLYKMKNRMLVTAVYCAMTFVAGLSMVTQGGIYVFQLFDYYSASGFVLLWVCFFETVVIGWIVGIDKFTDAINLMTGRRIPYWFSLCWRYLTPAISTPALSYQLLGYTALPLYNSPLNNDSLLTTTLSIVFRTTGIQIRGIFVFMLADFKPLKYNKTYEYPLSAQLMGAAMAVVSMVFVLAVFIFRFIRYPGNLRQKWSFATTPDFNRAGCPPKVGNDYTKTEMVVYT